MAKMSGRVGADAADEIFFTHDNLPRGPALAEECEEVAIEYGLYEKLGIRRGSRRGRPLWKLLTDDERQAVIKEISHLPLGPSGTNSVIRYASEVLRDHRLPKVYAIARQSTRAISAIYTKVAEDASKEYGRDISRQQVERCVKSCLAYYGPLLSEPID